MNKIRLKIGEFSKLNQVTVKTLRLYEQVGILVPREKDEWTGYRYYGVDQMKAMSNIIYFKKLGFSLEEIKSMFDQGITTPTAQMVEQKIKICTDEQQRLNWRYNELIALKMNLKTEDKMENIITKSLPAITVASYRGVLKSYTDLFTLCPNVIGPEMQRLGCNCAEPGYCYTIDHSKGFKKTGMEVEYCEAVTARCANSDIVKFKDIPAVKTAVCFSHYGSYEKLPQTWAKVLEYMESKGLTIADSPRFCYIDGVWNKDDENDWLTEIQVPVE